MKNTSGFEEEVNIDLRAIIGHYLSYWKWLVFSVIIFVSISLIYLRYSKPIYVSNATVLIKDDKKGGGMPGGAIFDDLGLSGGTSNLENEIQIFKSRKLSELVAKRLSLNVRYSMRSQRSGFKSGELYHKSPIELRHAFHDSLLYDFNSSFEILILDTNSFQISEVDNEMVSSINFGDTLNSSVGPLIISKRINFNNYTVGLEYVVDIKTLTTSISAMNLSISKVNKEAEILVISAQGSVIKKNNDIINELIFQHGLEEIKDKNEIAENTRDFIKDRMIFISRELSEVDSASLQFKTENEIIDVVTNSQLLLEKDGELEKAIVDMKIQLELVRFMKVEIEKNNGVVELLPSNLGFDDQSVGTMIDNYNTMVLERNRLLGESSTVNPSVYKLESQLKNMKESIGSSLNNIVSTANMKLKMLNSKAQLYTSQLASIPSYEKEYRDIYRQQQIKETLYLYLLEKREENEIALVATVANSKVIDDAYCNEKPISPKKNIVVLVALLLGLIFPISIIYIKDLFDNKVHSTEDLDRFNLSHVGVIPLEKEDIKLVALNNPRSVMSEAFRILRTNTSFLFPKLKNKGNTILVTSTIAGEGKSSISLNLGHSLALTGKKTIIIGLDLRAPKLLQYLDLQVDLKGVSDFIVNDHFSAKDIAFPIKGVDNLFMIPSGTTPPNPSELLMNSRLEELLNHVKKEYDYVIIDTAPVGLVTDTLIVAHLTDITLYVVRADKLEKNMLNVPSQLNKENKLTNMSVVLNGAGSKNSTSYGYGYGYGEQFEKDNKRWWQFNKK